MTHLSDLEIAALIDQGIPENQSSRIEQHLQHCGYCASRVEETRAVMTALSEPVESLWEQLTGKLFRLRNLIPVNIRLRRADIDARGFPSGLHFAQQLSGMLDKSSSKEVGMASIEVPSPDHHFLFKLTWQPSRTSLTDVYFQVVDRVKLPASPHITVQLRKKDSGQMLEWRRTDNTGQVIFKELEAGDYLIQVTYYEGLTVEIPFSIREQHEEER